jgi:hypothetical protein
VPFNWNPEDNFQTVSAGEQMLVVVNHRSLARAARM